MIKLDTLVDIEGNEGGKRLVQADLISDNSGEVVANGIDCKNIIGLNDTDKLVFGSTCLTSDLEFGMLDSTGTWKF